VIDEQDRYANARAEMDRVLAAVDAHAKSMRAHDRIRAPKWADQLIERVALSRRDR
jgi:hypothetical protein